MFHIVCEDKTPLTFQSCGVDACYWETQSLGPLSFQILYSLLAFTHPSPAYCLSKSFDLHIAPHSNSPSLPYPSTLRPSNLSILTSIPFHNFGITPSIKTKSDYRQIFTDNTTRSLWDPTSNHINSFYIIKITLFIKFTGCIPFQSD